MTTRSVQRTTQTPALRIVEAVSNAANVDPTELSPPLGSVIDPEALDTVMSADTSANLTVEFEYAGYRITARSGGELSVERPDGPR